MTYGLKEKGDGSHERQVANPPLQRHHGLRENARIETREISNDVAVNVRYLYDEELVQSIMVSKGALGHKQTLIRKNEDNSTLLRVGMHVA